VTARCALASVTSLDEYRRVRQARLATALATVPGPSSQEWREAVGFFTAQGRTPVEAWRILARGSAGTIAPPRNARGA